MNSYSKREKCRAILSLLVVVLAITVSCLYPSHSGVAQATIVATAVVAKTNYKSWTLTALDADTTLAINHGFKGSPPGASPSTDVAPDFVVLQPLVSYANAALPNWGVSVSSTQITVTKTNATASGGASPGTTVIAKLYAWRPHSIAE